MLSISVLLLILIFWRTLVNIGGGAPEKDAKCSFSYNGIKQILCSQQVLYLPKNKDLGSCRLPVCRALHALWNIEWVHPWAWKLLTSFKLNSHTGVKREEESECWLSTVLPRLNCSQLGNLLLCIKLTLTLRGILVLPKMPPIHWTTCIVLSLKLPTHLGEACLLEEEVYPDCPEPRVLMSPWSHAHMGGLCKFSPSGSLPS